MLPKCEVAFSLFNLEKAWSLVCYYLIPLSISHSREGCLCSRSVVDFACSNTLWRRWALAHGLIGPSRPHCHAFRQCPGEIGCFQSGSCYLQWEEGQQIDIDKQCPRIWHCPQSPFVTGFAAYGWLFWTFSFTGKHLPSSFVVFSFFWKNVSAETALLKLLQELLVVSCNPIHVNV